MNQPYRFMKDGKILDILPYYLHSGQNEIVLGPNQIVLSIEGFSTVTRYGTVDAGELKIVSIPSLCILKLLSYSSKRYKRLKDLDDFYSLVENYTRVNQEIVFEESYIDLLIQSGDVELTRAWILGSQMRAVLQYEPKLSHKIGEILNSLLKGMNETDINLLSESEATRREVQQLKLTLKLINGYYDKWN